MPNVNYCINDCSLRIHVSENWVEKPLLDPKLKRLSARDELRNEATVDFILRELTEQHWDFLEFPEAYTSILQRWIHRMGVDDTLTRLNRDRWVIRHKEIEGSRKFLSVNWNLIEKHDSTRTVRACEMQLVCWSTGEDFPVQEYLLFEDELDASIKVAEFLPKL